MYHLNYTEKLADNIDGIPANISSTTNCTLLQSLGINKMYDLFITSRNGVGESDPSLPSTIVPFTSITSSKLAM